MSAAVLTQTELPRLAYRVAQAAKILDVSPDTVYRLIRANKLDAVKAFNCTLVPLYSIEHFLGYDKYTDASWQVNR